MNLAMAGVMDEPQISADVRAALFLRHHMVDVELLAILTCLVTDGTEALLPPGDPALRFAGRAPSPGVDRPEQVLGVGMPAPAQVAGQLAQRLQHLGQDRADGEPSDCTHPPNLVLAPGGVQACQPTGLGLRGSTRPVARPIGLAP